ncbi:MAG: NAD(P)-dependent oxidoreductase [Bacteroidales bacterium]|nr:NAD(P)-dependent oxidoreductase [Bacteroidales bacterium]
MKILVTGGAGYKGIVLTSKLLEKGYKVTILDNFMYGYEPVLHLVKNKNLSIIKADIRNTIESLQKYDVIFHLAGISGYPACAANPHSAHLINVQATRNILRKLCKDQLIIYASTTSFYGRSGEPCDEKMPITPFSVYANTKYMAEQITMEKENAIALRFATIFGFSPKMRIDLMVNDFTYKAVKEGVLVIFDSFAKRTFMHVDDAALCYIFTLEHAEKMKGNIYNAGGNHLNYSKLEIANLIRDRVNYNIIDSEVQDNDLRHFIVTFDKIEKMGFKPTISVEQGIDELLKVYKFYEYYSHFKTI